MSDSDRTCATLISAEMEAESEEEDDDDDDDGKKVSNSCFSVFCHCK